jgi:HEPN domain-containing protein
MQPEDAKLALTRAWLIKADHDLQMADRALLAPPLLDSVVFHCHQAAEKALKGYLTWHDQVLRKTHNLEELVRRCAGNDASFLELVDAAQMLTPFAAEFRYPGEEEVPTAEAAHEALGFARQVVTFVAERLPPEASA